jgi:hypothetical protein
MPAAVASIARISASISVRRYATRYLPACLRHNKKRGHMARVSVDPGTLHAAASESSESWGTRGFNRASLLAQGGVPYWRPNTAMHPVKQPGTALFAG